MNNLALIVMDNIYELGNSVDKKLMKLNNSKSFIIDTKSYRFNNGEGKFKIFESIKNRDIYILSDVGNYSLTYKMHGQNVIIGPDEHFQDIKRCISALSGYAKSINIVMPLLYQSRQDERNSLESLDCSLALHELENLGVKKIITFDVHDKGVFNSVVNLSIENYYPTNLFLPSILKNKDSNFLVVAPDMGAMQRARFFADTLKCNLGVFYKRRDLTCVVDGKNPIIEHVYLGEDVSGKNVIVVDDMIATGTSILEVAKMLHKKKASNIYLVSTFSLFTDGIQSFEETFKNKIFDKLYTTNLSYIPEKIKQKEWIEVVDSSLCLANIINHKDI